VTGERLSASPAVRALDAEPDLLRGAERQVLAATAAAGAMIAQLVFGKAARDALFLSTFRVSSLPVAMICAAGLSAIAVIGLSRAMTRYSPARVVPWLFAISAGLFVAECLLSVWSAPVATAVFYLHMSVFGATVISSFWSLVNERFDPHTAKRVVGRIATGGTLGGIVGSVIAWRVSAYLGVPALLLLLAGLNGLCFWGTLPLRAKGTHHEEPRPLRESVPPAMGLSYLRDMPYLRHLGWLIGLAGVTSSLLDYVLAARAATFASGRSLMAFFAIFYMSIALIGFLVQVLLTRVSLEKLGVSGTVTTLPVVVAGAGVLALALPGLVTVVAVRAAEAVLQNSLFRAGYELLYTSIARERKRSLKLLIDVGFDRAGIAVGSAFTMLIIWLLPGFAERLLLGGIVTTAVAGVVVARKLHAGYVSTLEESMRTRTEHLEATEAVTGTARRSFTHNDPGLDKAYAGGSPRAGSSGGTGIASELDTPDGHDGFLDSIAKLRSGDLARVREVLSLQSFDARLVSHVIPLLAVDELARDVVQALRSVGSRVSGQLVDTLLDPTQDAVVRRRIPRVLRVCDSKVAVTGLTSALADELFDIRHQSGLALFRITKRKPDLSPSEADVLAAVLREVAKDQETWDSQRLQDALDDDDGEHTDDIMRERSRSLEHVFRLLSLVHEREPLELAFHALGSEDDRLRGTALEYLENILSREIRDRLWTYLGDLREYQRSARSQSELLAELKRLATLTR
jgi:ATP:ADP antiporter, AAA family